MNTTLLKKSIELCKPRIVGMVLVATATGYLLGSRATVDFPKLLVLLLGTACVSAGGAMLNNVIERDFDSLMERTRERALATGLISPAHALIAGILLAITGSVLLASLVNLLCGFLALLTAFLYVLVYTPLKRVTWMNTLVGAVPGALPPLGGWVAATGSLDLGGWLLFAILFVWQLPHFYAIAWMYRADYARAGYKMLPVVDPDGSRTMRQILISSVILVPVSLLPSLLNLCGSIYLVGTFSLGLLMLSAGFVLRQSHSIRDARGLLRASLVYLPLLLLLVAVDHAGF